jgi:hypothetical protein
MEKIVPPRVWYQRRIYQILLAIAALYCAWWGSETYKELTMPPIFVYLLPEDFIGLVYVFFDQKDGVSPKPDPLGQAVQVPDNGVVKLAGSVDQLLRPVRFDKRPEAMVMVAKNGSRRILKMFAGPFPNEDNEAFWEGYIDENDQLHKFDIHIINNPKPVDEKRFYYMSNALMNERMVFSKDGCSHQAFVKNPGKIRSGEADPMEVGVPSCAKFLIASPKEFLEMPDWLWREPSRQLYESIDEFTQEANEHLIKKKAFYGQHKQ